MFNTKVVTKFPQKTQAVVKIFNYNYSSLRSDFLVWVHIMHRNSLDYKKNITIPKNRCCVDPQNWIVHVAHVSKVQKILFTMANF